MATGMEQHTQIMKNLGNTPAAEDIVYMEGRHTGLTLWFSGPRQARSFVAHSCSGEHPLRDIQLEVLLPKGQCVARRPDDILAVQESGGAYG
jgi:hypothetical protein